MLAGIIPLNLCARKNGLTLKILYVTFATAFSYKKPLYNWIAPILRAFCKRSEIGNDFIDRSVDGDIFGVDAVTYKLMKTNNKIEERLERK